MKKWWHYTHIVLDFDGVIVDSNAIKMRCIEEAVGTRFSKSVAKEFSTFFTQNNGVPREVKIGQYFSGIDYQRILSTYNELLDQKLARCQLTEGVAHFLGLAKEKGIRLHVLSGGDLREVKDLLTNKNIHTYFHGVYGAPKTKEENLALMDLKGDKLFIGDSKKDYEVAENFSMDFIFMYGYTQFDGWQAFFNNKPAVVLIRDFCALQVAA